jgi:hypothetical protein
VHHNAKRAVVAVCVDGMDVRHLHHGQQRQQHQAHERYYRQSTWLSAAFSARKCLESCPHTHPLLKNTHPLDGLKPETVTAISLKSGEESAQPLRRPPV